METKPIIKPNPTKVPNPATPSKPAINPGPKNSDTQTKPLTKPTTVPNPATPSKPAVNPGPKNLFSELEKVMKKYLKLGGFINEANKTDLGLSNEADRNITKDMPAENDMAATMATQKVVELNSEITKLEKELYTKEQLQTAVIDVLKAFFKNGKGFNLNNVNIDAKIVYGSDEEGESSIPEFDEIEKLDPKLKDAVNKRRLANYITQGFSFSSFDKLFEEEPEKAIDFIDQEVIQLYFDYFATMKEANEKVNIETIKQLVKMLQQLKKAGGSRAVKQALSQMKPNQETSAIQGSVIIDYDEDPNKPTIVARASNFITLFHETLKGIYELMSHHGLKYDENTLKKIYNQTENWIEEYKAFKYGSRVVNLFLGYFKEVEDTLIKKGEIFEYDYSMAAAFLAYIYNQDYMKDSEFLAFMDKVLQGKGDINKGCEIYINAKSFNDTEDLSDSDEETYIGNVDDESNEIEDLKNKNISSDISLDDILDKISNSGMNSLTPKEKELLAKYSNKESRIIKLTDLMILLENRKKNKKI